MADDTENKSAPRSPLERVLSLFAETHAGEGITAILLTVDVFLLFVCYYLLKVAREPLILQSGAEVKAYTSGAKHSCSSPLRISTVCSRSA